MCWVVDGAEVSEMDEHPESAVRYHLAGQQDLFTRNYGAQYYADNYKTRWKMTEVIKED